MTICKGNEPWADKHQLTVFFCHYYGVLITGMNPKESFGKNFRSKLRGYYYTLHLTGLFNLPIPTRDL
jgi:hypothetical protein